MYSLQHPAGITKNNARLCECVLLFLHLKTVQLKVALSDGTKPRTEL